MIKIEFCLSFSISLSKLDFPKNERVKKGKQIYEEDLNKWQTRYVRKPNNPFCFPEEVICYSASWVFSS